MNNLKFIFFIQIVFMFTSCKTYKVSLATTGNYEDAIKNCMIDFSTTKLFKNGSFFVIDYSSISDDIYIIRIMDDNENKYLYSNNIPFSENKLPSKSHQIDKKIFVWWDKNYPVDQGVINLLNSYGMLIDNTDGHIFWLDKIIFEKKKAATYYVCKQNISIFERKISNFSDDKHSVRCEMKK